MEGGFLGLTGGINHGSGIATKGGEWLGLEGGTLPRGSKSPTLTSGIAKSSYVCASASIIKSVVSSVIATTTTIGDVVAPMILFTILAASHG